MPKAEIDFDFDNCTNIKDGAILELNVTLKI